MNFRERVEKYKEVFPECKAIEPVRQFIASKAYVVGSDLEKLEAVRELNTELSDLYQVSIPVITVWVRDDSYVAATGEIYLAEPSLENFLHQFRHHLQNIERKYERRGLTAEDSLDKDLRKLPYTDTVHRMYGEDDARAWGRFVIEAALED